MKEPKVIECDSTPGLPVLVMISGLSIDHSWLEDLSRQFIALRPLKQIFASSDELYLPDATHFVAVEEAAAIARALVTFTSFLRPEGGLRLARML